MCVYSSENTRTVPRESQQLKQKLLGLGKMKVLGDARYWLRQLISQSHVGR